MSDDRKAAQPPGGAALAATAPSPGPAPPPATTVDPRRLSLTVPDAAPNDLAAQANGVTGITIAAAEQHDKSPPASTLFLNHDDVDELADDDDLDMLAGDDAGPVASTSKAVPSSTTAPSSSSSVKRYAGSLATPANPPQKKHRSSAAFGDKPGVYRPPPLPHYTLVRSANNSKASPHVIRIHDDASDGSDTRWPSEAERQPDHKVAGRQNYYECPPRDVGKHKSFREKLGEELASKLGLAEQEPGASWIIEDLPKGHLFTVHHCVTKSNQPRTDVYVFGSSATLKFRTANEFVPHLYWLVAHGPDDSLRCECKYCTKTSQSDVNRVVGLTDGRASSVASGGGGGGGVGDRAGTPRRAAVASGGSATAAKVAKAGDPGTEKLLPSLKKGKRALDGVGTEASGGPATKRKKKRASADSADKDDVSKSASPPPTYRGSFTMRQRDEDLKDVGVPRQTEVVWVKLARPLRSREEGGTTITHWPGLVSAREFASEAKVLAQGRDKVDGAGGEDAGGKGKGKEREEAVTGTDEGPAGASRAPKAPFRLSTTQRPVFTVSLIGLDDEMRRVELADLLPWLAHTPPSALMRPEYIMSPDSARHVWDGTRTTRDAKVVDFKDAEDAATAIALACQIVAHVVASFSPGEKYALTPEGIAHKESASPDEVATVERQAAQAWTFQCVYFGAELVWPGDVVRLLSADLPDSLGPEVAAIAKAREDRAFFLRVAMVYKPANSGSLRLAGEVWALEDAVHVQDEPRANGSNGPPGTGGPGPTTNGAAPPAELNGSAARPPTPVGFPRAPAGLQWKQVTAPGRQAHFDLEFIGGRVHPLPAAYDTRARIADVRESFAPLEAQRAEVEARRAEGAEGGELDLDEGGEALTLNDEQRSLVLAGLKPTVRMYMRLGAWRATRLDAILEAEKRASEEVGTFFKDRAKGPASNGTASREGSAAAA